MTELRQAREIDLVPEELRFQPQVKSDIIIQRRKVSLAPIEAANEYHRDGTNTLTWNLQGHKELSQLLDSKSLYFEWQVKFANGYPVEDVSMLVEEIVISSQGRTLERIRHAQYIQHFIRGYGMTRKKKALLGKREGFQCYEDRTIQYHSAPAAAAVAPGQGRDGNNGFSKQGSQSDFRCNIPDGAEPNATRMDENLGYYKEQVARNAGAMTTGFGQYKLMKFKLECSGLLSADKMLPIGWCPLQIQLRLSDKQRATDSNNLVERFDYKITRPRMHFDVCSVGQSYASALQSRLRGPGLTLNCKMFDTFFQVITGDKQIVVPSNKQRLSKVWVMFHPESAAAAGTQNAFHSSVCGEACPDGITANKGKRALRSVQFQIGTEVSEPIALNQPSGDLNPAQAGQVNSGMGYLEAYLKAIGAVNGQMDKTDFWGQEMNKYLCSDYSGGDLLQTFLSKYFTVCYDGEKLLGSQIETGVDTENGKDCVIDLRFAEDSVQGQRPPMRVMVLIQYHAQLIIKENDVSISF